MCGGILCYTHLWEMICHSLLMVDTVSRHVPSSCARVIIIHLLTHSCVAQKAAAASSVLEITVELPLTQ